jgi:hypothetical protein
MVMATKELLPYKFVELSKGKRRKDGKEKSFGRLQSRCKPAITYTGEEESLCK